MLKKMLIGTLLVGLIGALIVGAVIRTSDRVNKVAEAYDGQGRSVAEAAAQGNGGRTQYNSDGRLEEDLAAQGNGGARWDATGESVTANGNHGRGGNSTEERNVADNELGLGQAAVDEWIKLEGTVSAVDDTTLTVTTAEGEVLTIENRAWTFAQEEGFSVQPGDNLRMTGFYEDGELEVGTIENLTAGTMIQLREESGRPLWAGRGRRGA